MSPDLFNAWDRLAGAIQRLETSLPQQMSEAVTRLEDERKAFAAALWAEAKENMNPHTLPKEEVHRVRGFAQRCFNEIAEPKEEGGPIRSLSLNLMRVCNHVIGDQEQEPDSDSGEGNSANALAVVMGAAAEGPRKFTPDPTIKKPTRRRKRTTA